MAEVAHGQTGGCIPLLIQALQNERHAPELLPYPELLVNETLDLLNARAANAIPQPVDPNAPPSLLAFKPSDLYRMEMQRINFLVSDLIRIRLKKIQERCFRIQYFMEEWKTNGRVEDPTGQFLVDALSENEKHFAEKLGQYFTTAMMEGGMKHFPLQYQSLVPGPRGEEMEMIEDVPLSKHVVVTILDNDLGAVDLGYGARQEVQAGDIFLVQYGVFRELILTGKARLV